jgi:YHS domain-containing protein
MSYTPRGYTLFDTAEREGPRVIDPVCGMDVMAESATGAWEHAGTTYYFCSVGCLERFRIDPGHFLAMGPEERHM